MALLQSPAGPRTDDGTAGTSLLAESRELAGRLAWPTTAARDDERRWDTDLFTRLADTQHGRGLTGPLVPRALGGRGLSAADTCELLEGLAEGSRDPGLALALTVHAVLVTVPLRAFGTPAQREHYLPPMASGQWFGALSLHQTQGASLTPAVTARPSTSDHDGWVLTGELDLVAGAPHAHHFLVVAAHQDGTRTAFVLDRTTPGLLLRDSAPTAMRTCPWGRLVLDDCPAPADTVLGTPGEASAEVEPLLAALDWVFAAAPWLGIMRALARDTIGASRDRTLFGRPLAHSQSTRFALADLATRTELAQGLLRRTAGLFDAGGRPTLPQAAAARLFVASCARAVTEAAARITGPLTPTGDRLAERAFRDALFFSETGGGPAVLQPVIAAHLLGIG
ncbi:acyl-CoA dehydrogenase family protein [Streptomyces sp. NBC_01218]|uniref:acyl-CoA dehydrogenase family protein n=1 Tax=Streptomyces sp. NBC_01218 TaxID=2903780 RepID=UPI002E13C380|nr:acyl-CoA dehydrogenase family protein [Streptomyces sp. NBC_01218]WSQ55101.1 acyl-CoA dehydrogenase family protein [Streptomyces sp. NBC_01218]